MVTITFSDPVFLWFLFIIPLLVIGHFYLLRRAKRKAMQFANFVALRRATGERFITKNYTLLVLRLLIVICAILAAAGTSIWYEELTSQNAYVIAIDTSASMTAEDILPNRLEAAKTYAAEFVDEVDPYTSVGLVSFSGVTFIESTLTTKHDEVVDAVSLLESNAAGTDIPGAIITGVNMLTATDRGRVIVLITDGSNTIEDFRSKSLQRAISYALAYHTTIYTIGVGKNIKTPIGYLPTYYNVSATYDEQNVNLIANSTGGRSFLAADEFELQRTYSEIINEVRATQLEHPLRGWLLMICLVLLMVEWGLANTRFRALP